MKIFFFVLVFSHHSWASGKEVYDIGRDKVNLIQMGQLWVSPSCQKKSCDALKFGEEKKSNLKPELLVGGKNPEAVRCKEIFKARVLIGTDKKGNSQSLCQFPDGSILKN